jgi:chromosome segregation protein
VDATLDDSNTIKFIQYLHKYSEKQMILITHNRMTMKEADTLIGVTMEKPGISSLVPVNLRKFEEEFGESIKEK